MCGKNIGSESMFHLGGGGEPRDISPPESPAKNLCTV